MTLLNKDYDYLITKMYVNDVSSIISHLDNKQNGFESFDYIKDILNELIEQCIGDALYYNIDRTGLYLMFACHLNLIEFYNDRYKT